MCNISIPSSSREQTLQLLPQRAAQGSTVNEKECKSIGPAKIAPPKYPKAIRETSTPRCAMQAKIPESRIDERKNSQEGKYEESEIGPPDEAFL
jgi:hypothetical protein